MKVRWVSRAIFVVAFLVGSAQAFPQTGPPITQKEFASLGNRAPAPTIEEIVFVGLRRIARATLEAQISTRAGQALDTRRLEADVRALARLGWFRAIRVETQDVGLPPDTATKTGLGVRLIFQIEEEPFLAGVDYSGSRLLSPEQIEKMFTEKKAAGRLGAPADPAILQRIARTIQSALAELGHPQANVRIFREELPNATVRVRFEINDGPHTPVGQVQFEGDPAVPTKTLARQMRRIKPGGLFAELRGGNAYTHEAFEEDRERILAYYQNHGYPEARIGEPGVSSYEKSARRWFLWLHRVTRTHLALNVPAEAGRLYRIDSIETGDSLREAAEKRRAKHASLPKVIPRQAYSAQMIENMRRAWLARVQPIAPKNDSAPHRCVEVTQTLNREAGTAHVKFALVESPPYVVRHIEFRGNHKFSDRFYRRRILLEEGRPFDERALEAGLARLARTGYFHPIKKEDIAVRTDEASHTTDVTIRIEEIGQQRALLVGGHGSFGNTLGIAYTIFDLLRREELLSAQIEGGPESLQIALGLAKEGFLGSRGALAFSVFNNVIRPRFASSPQGPFFTMRSEGVNMGWSYALTNTDAIGVNYGLSHSTTDYSLALPAGLTGLLPSQVRSEVSSRSAGFAWTYDAGNEHTQFANSVSGGWLGGGENLLRSSAEYGRIFHDPVFARQNAWAFRTSVGGVGSYQGDMPLYARLFSGDDLVRGLRPSELGPYAIVSTEAASGAKTYSATPAGSDFVTAANAEYRVSLGGGSEAAGFFDLGSGLLLPNWLGRARPSLLDSTNGLLHGSTGIELRWTVPGVQVPIRAHYAFNVLRLDRSLLLPDNSLFRAHNRFAAFGWALGSLF
ncbi:MAG: hypothetical protein AUG07_00110 [Acidobacteria bacterium 13_1_20CM_2_60_10]|nr:MAG: hypothetical protein AUG07_00110 [Acidobacteria bacterium 13_1_20CM_2_60_10]